MYWFITCFRGRRGRIARASRETPTARQGARRRFAARATEPRRLDIKSQLPLKKGANKSPGDRRGTRGAKKRDVYQPGRTGRGEKETSSSKRREKKTSYFLRRVCCIPCHSKKPSFENTAKGKKKKVHAAQVRRLAMQNPFAVNRTGSAHTLTARGPVS